MNIKTLVIVARSGSWNLGANEAIPGPGQATPTIISWRDLSPC